MFTFVRSHQAIGLTAALLLICLSTPAEDIDIFVGGTGMETTTPNILFVLDNSANWSRNAQHWLPKGVVQGQAEVRAIRNALTGLTNKVNVGVMMFATQEPNVDAGYVRHAIKPLNATNQVALNAKFDRIYNNINEPAEKRPAQPKYGYLMQDVYQYLIGGNAVNNGAGTPSLADSAGYQTNYSRFASPLTSDNLCADTYVIFIANAVQTGVTNDDLENSSALGSLVTAAGGTPDGLAPSGTGPIPIPEFIIDSRGENVALGYTDACYKKQTDCTAAENTEGSACREAGYSQCVCGSNVKRPHTCSKSNEDNYDLIGKITTDTAIPTGDFDSRIGSAWNLDDWAKFMFVHGVPIPGATTDDPRGRVITYTIDVFNAQQSKEHTGLLLSTAKVGGGGYFMAKSQEALEDAIGTIISEIISVNSTFASASLPISATNRAQNENQVFIGMFRPEPLARPRWFGNLKRYQLAHFDDRIDLADAEGRRAVNNLSGFVAECAASYWTTDSEDYWALLGIVPEPMSQCLGTAEPYSDKPDGPFVEKGGAGQVLRRSTIANRHVYTRFGNSLVAFNTSNTSLDSELVDYTRGMDIDHIIKDNTLTDPRPTIHGDIVHSRPLPVNYGSYHGVTVFYGANDGTLRAVNATNGAERWSFIAPEHFDKLTRLRANEPLVAYPNQDQAANPLPKDYFFDGSIGQVVRYGLDNQASAVWIFPTMRRGGRLVYALDVTSPDNPTLKWYAGCPNLTNDTSCSSGFTDIGQTWSIPNAGYVAGYLSGADPVLVMGGGYDACEDTDSATPSCGSSKGRTIYVLSAATGAIIRTFATDRPVTADVSLVDLDYDGTMDLAYAADTGGNLYRISFIDSANDDAPLSPESWSMLKIATTQGDGRKFLYGPAVMPYKGYVYLALGSGNRERPLETNYPYTSSIQDRFYVFLDRPHEDPTTAETHPIDLDDTTMLFDYSTNTTCADEILTPESQHRGWFMDLQNRGEQTVTNALIVAGMATFSTSRPGGSGVGICSRPIGIASGYWVNLFNGSGAIGVAETCGGRRSSDLAGGGLPPAPVLATVPVDGKPTTVVIGAPPRDGSTGTPISPQEIRPAIANKRGRVFWSSDTDR
jgi:type IV pilus assembly protein PilY1